MEIFGIIVVCLLFLAIVILHHPNEIKMIEATPDKIAGKVKLMLIQGKTYFVIQHDYLGNTEHKYMRHALRNKDIIDAICNVCPDDKININCLGNTVVINVIE